MRTFFPHHTVNWHFEEPTLVRRFSLSLVEMAVLTGITLRLYRALVLMHGGTSWAWLGGGLAVGLLLLCALATLHLANFPLQRWLWRAPLFALVEIAAESVTSAGLIWFGREPYGSARAEWNDWLPMAGETLWTRGLTVCLWAAILALAVVVVRRTILTEEYEEESAES